MVFLSNLKLIYIFSYNLESYFQGPPLPNRKSTEELRDERLLEEILNKDTQSISYSPLEEKSFVPKTIFEKNLSPSLQPKD